MYSDDLRLALAPTRAYASLVAISPAGSWRALAARLGFLALLLGTAITIAATGRVTLADLLLATLSWGFVLDIQALAAIVIIRSSPRRTVSLPRALDLLFAGHVPWSLWLLGMAAWVTITAIGGLKFIAITALVPAVWTVIILAAYCRTVLRASQRETRHCLLTHQAIIWSVVLIYGATMSALWPRLLGAIGR